MLKLHVLQAQFGDCLVIECGTAAKPRYILIDGGPPLTYERVKAMAPFHAAVSLLTTMPGLSDTAARVLIAEIGDDMTRFPTPGHLVSWAGLCPRLDISAGKRHSSRSRHATPWLKTTLIQGSMGGNAEEGQLPACAIYPNQEPVGDPRRP